MKGLFLRSALVVVFVTTLCVGVGQAASATVDKGKKVKFDYTLKVGSTVVETSLGRAPVEYVQGEGKIIPGLEAQLQGLKAGEQKKFTLLPKDGYGEANPQAFREFPKTMFPKDFVAKKGLIIELQGDKGQVVPATIAEVKQDTVLLDFNHPLAGKTLQFDVKIISVQ